MHQLGIRFAGAADFPQLRRLYRQLAEAEYALETPHRGLLRPLEDRIRELSTHLEALGSKDAFWFVAPGPDALIGSVGVREVRPSPLVVPVMEIRDLVVDMAHGMYSTGRTLVCGVE